ncbi:helix-turn-helix domain-containing protein [Paenibacillus harenae]|uniref:DNA-binding transcriptional MerR regulator n=1 Tax=Paenibacillus harenae TaxID=306543 RepID=A0ABT9U476_PAEHA|nr:MerR family transcriptional regulator [Paenibacillus harenae]MDQ0113783.1 DNA-binding transcriptional MerR regulator [Paenibacillus harenae]
MTKGFTMKQMLEICGITEDAVRYYEKIGLLPPVERKPNGHRLYSLADKETLLSIKCFKKIGMTLDEIKLFHKLQNADDTAMSKEVSLQLQNYQLKIKDQQQQLQQIWDLIETKLQSGHKVGIRTN